MNKRTIEKFGIRSWNVADHLENGEEIVDYLRECANEDDELFLHVLGEIAKAKGMSELAKATGISREYLYKALSSNGNPSYKTLRTILSSLGFRIRFESTTLANATA